MSEEQSEGREHREGQSRCETRFKNYGPKKGGRGEKFKRVLANEIRLPFVPPVPPIRSILPERLRRRRMPSNCQLRAVRVKRAFRSHRKTELVRFLFFLSPFLSPLSSFLSPLVSSLFVCLSTRQRIIAFIVSENKQFPCSFVVNRGIAESRNPDSVIIETSVVPQNKHSRT